MYDSNESPKAIDALTKRIDRLESNATIVKLMADYCHGIDKHDLDLFSSVWHPDGVLGMGEGLGAHKGIEEIQHFIRDLVWIELLPESHHWTTNISLMFSDDDHAEATSDVLTVATDSSDSRLSIAATYYDKFERRNGVWRLSRRDSQIHYQLPIVVPEAQK
ncbi:nuclear transport factor 2 family protein [Rhodococcus sp. NPDC056960]|uniref:nuclear transport factor 2 family protein n=1 Tax=Rhodococcus TaxID=1827 RepID=UPI003638BB26